MTESMKDLVLHITDTTGDKLFTKRHARNPVKCKRSTISIAIAIFIFSLATQKISKKYNAIH